MRENKKILNGLKETVQTYKIQKTILVEYVSTELSATTFLGKG